MDNEPNEAGSSPWRQPIIWLVIALVAAAVAGGAVMIRVAGSHVDSVPDQVQRTAGAQTTDLGPDEAALQRQLSAVVRIDAKLGIVQALPASGEFDRNAPLRLSLHHPLYAADDVDLVLAPSELGWEAPAEIDTSHDWNLQLAAEDGHWRLLGRLTKDRQAARVAPSLQREP